MISGHQQKTSRIWPTQDTTYLKERWSTLSENAGWRDRGANPCCQFSHSEDKEKIFCWPISWLLHSWWNFLRGGPARGVLSCFSITSAGGWGLEQCRAGVRALTRMEFLSPCLGSSLRPRGEAVCKCQAAQLRVKTAWNLYTFLHGFKFSRVCEWGWLQPKEVFMKWQRKSVLTEQVPENILTPFLSLWFDFSPCYNGKTSG